MSSSAKMSAIKLKMEERRRCIQKERAKLEAARSKHRQEIGKTAFMRVIKVRIYDLIYDCLSFYYSFAPDLNYFAPYEISTCEIL